MNAIDELFRRLRSQKRKAFIPFITAGDADLETTVALIEELARRGAGPIEIGFPYSDPIADGSVIQASYTRALNNGLKIDDIFRSLGKLDCAAPLVGMVSYSLVHHRGAETFVNEARAAGFSGAIVPDLPVEEADELTRLAAAHDFKLIHLVTPTTPREAGLIDQLRWLRTQTDLPLCVGFGISKPEHVRMLRDHVDGVIVGSALVRRLEQTKPLTALVKEIGELVQNLAEALNG